MCRSQLHFSAVSLLETAHSQYERALVHSRIALPRANLSSLGKVQYELHKCPPIR